MISYGEEHVLAWRGGLVWWQQRQLRQSSDPMEMDLVVVAVGMKKSLEGEKEKDKRFKELLVIKRRTMVIQSCPDQGIRHPFLINFGCYVFKGEIVRYS